VNSVAFGVEMTITKTLLMSTDKNTYKKTWTPLQNRGFPTVLIPEDATCRRVAVISAKNHKRQRRKRQSVTARKVANAKVLNRNTNLNKPNLT